MSLAVYAIFLTMTGKKCIGQVKNSWNFAIYRQRTEYFSDQ